jgi:hypothetical protein
MALSPKRGGDARNDRDVDVVPTMGVDGGSLGIGGGGFVLAVRFHDSVRIENASYCAWQQLILKID